MNAAAARTVHQVRIYRSVGLAKRPRRLPRQLPPLAIERAYARRLLAFVALARELLKPLLDELPGLLESAARDLGRTDAGEHRRIQQLIEIARQRLAAALNTRQLEALARDFARQTSTYQRIQLDRQTRAALGIDVFANDRSLETIIEAYVVENVALIKDIPERVARDVELLTMRAVSTGTLWRDLAKDLEKRFHLGEDRSRLIARDQIGKLYGQINAQRQKDIGVERFIWRTVGDERVRDEHDHLETVSDPGLGGTPFSYDNLPDEGLPGEPINCRCWAEPVLDDILNELDL